MTQSINSNTNIEQFVDGQIPQERWQNHIFRAFKKACRVMSNLIPRGMIFERVGTMTEKALSHLYLFHRTC